MQSNYFNECSSNIRSTRVDHEYTYIHWNAVFFAFSGERSNLKCTIQMFTPRGDLPKQPTPVPNRMLRSGDPKHAATAVLAFPNLANDISATKSPIEFAHARNVNPIIAVGIFQNTPRAVKRPTISFASQAIQSIAVIIPRAV